MNSNYLLIFVGAIVFCDILLTILTYNSNNRLVEEFKLETYKKLRELKVHELKDRLKYNETIDKLHKRIKHLEVLSLKAPAVKKKKVVKKDKE